MKKYTLVFHPLVQQDVQEAVTYYNSKSPGLGKRFFGKVKQRYESLKLNPDFQIRYDDVNCLPVDDFPYMIHFRVDKIKQEVFIEAILHTSKDPDKNWGIR
jgi:hypothetical protein